MHAVACGKHACFYNYCCCMTLINSNRKVQVCEARLAVTGFGCALAGTTVRSWHRKVRDSHVNFSDGVPALLQRRRPIRPRGQCHSACRRHTMDVITVVLAQAATRAHSRRLVLRGMQFAHCAHFTMSQSIYDNVFMEADRWQVRKVKGVPDIPANHLGGCPPEARWRADTATSAS